MCGVIGAFNVADPVQTIFSMAESLPHRGENGAGIALGNGTDEPFWERTQFNFSELMNKLGKKDLPGFTSGIGHIRYGTAGDDRCPENDAQPLHAEMLWGSIYLAHNGDSSFTAEDRKTLIDRGLIFSTSSDSEIMLHQMALTKIRDTAESIKNGLRAYRGTYALAMLVSDAEGLKLVAARDSSGNRPLSLGKLGDGYLLASEDSAFETVDGEYLREIKPGEILTISNSGLFTDRIGGIKLPLAECVYENVYFSLPTSNTFGMSVGDFRSMLGRYLAKRYGHLIKPGDIVTYIPDSANFFAQGFCDFLSRRLVTLMVRRHNTSTGRSYIQAEQKLRDDTLRRKFSFHRHKIARILTINPETRVWVIDDSIVRGNTSRRITRVLKRLGVKWVGFLSGAPVITGPCHKGIDMPGKDGKLVSVGRMKTGLVPDNEKIAEAIEADFVGYLPIQDLYDVVKLFGKDKNNVCFGCFENRDPIWGKW